MFDGVRTQESPTLQPGAVSGALRRPKCHLPESLPWPLRDATFFRTSRWLRPGCVPPLKFAKFEERVLYRYGPAQVGLDDLLILLSSSHRLFFGRLRPSHYGSRTPVGVRTIFCMRTQGALAGLATAGL
jgi:hypothetical protein